MAARKRSRKATPAPAAAAPAPRPSSAPRALPLAAAIGAFALHLPFVLRYDLHFQPDFAVSVLMSRAIAFEGEHPIFFWGQGYLGTYGCYLTALLFRLFGVSIPLAGAVSLAIWAAGVGLATALAGRLLGGRAALWTAVAAAVASPYANHYITQPFTSYETAPVLSVLTLGALLWGERLAGRPLSSRTAVAWAGLGVALGVAWWTTRLFVPSLVAVMLAVVLCHGLRALGTRSALVVVALLVAAALAGDGLEIAYRLHGDAVPQDTPSLAIAPSDMLADNVTQGVGSLAAYFNGDPRARWPEGATFALGLALGLDAYEGAEFQPGPIGMALDALAVVAMAAVIVTSIRLALRARRQGNAPLLALGLAVLVHLAIIITSAQTRGGYFEARRYWYGSLLVLPILFAAAIEWAEETRRAAVRWGARAFGAVLVLASLGSQARMLALDDELADYRVLTRELVASGEHALFMPAWDVWLVSALSGGTIDGVCTHYLRRPDQVERVARAERMAVVLPADVDFPPTLEIGDAVFEEPSETPHTLGPWRWVPYVRRPAA